MRYDVNTDGSLSNGKVFFDMTNAPGEDALDSYLVDRNASIQLHRRAITRVFSKRPFKRSIR